MKSFKIFLMICIASVSLNAAESVFPFGSLEKFWDYVETNTVKVFFDVKGYQNGEWTRNLAGSGIYIPYNRDEAIDVFTKRKVGEGVIATFAKYSDEELRQYDEFSTLVLCYDAGVRENRRKFYQISWTYKLEEKGGKLCIPEHIRNPELSLKDTGYRPGKVAGLQSAELFVRQNGGLQQYQPSWPFSPKGAHLLVGDEYLVVPMPLAVGNNGGELVLYYTNGTHKIIDLASGDVATSYPPLDQPELIISSHLYDESGELTPSSAKATPKSVSVKSVTVVKSRGRNVWVERSEDLRTWLPTDASTLSSNDNTEVFYDMIEVSKAFYRVRVD